MCRLLPAHVTTSVKYSSPLLWLIELPGQGAQKFAVDTGNSYTYQQLLRGHILVEASISL